MAENTNPQSNLEEIHDLLSLYLDGEVSDEERVLVEQALVTSPELQQELESLRQTIALVAALPPVPAPRPFTLSEADVQPTTPASKKRFWLPGWAGGLAMLTAALICVFVAGGIFLSNRFGGSQLAPAVEVARQEESALSPAAEGAAEEAPAEAIAEPAEAESIEVEEKVEIEAEVEMAEVAPLAEEEVAEPETEAAAAGTETDDTTTTAAGQAEAVEDNEAVTGRDADQDTARAILPPTGTPQPSFSATPLPQATPMMTIPLPATPPAGQALAEREETPADQAPPAAETSSELVREEAVAEAEQLDVAQSAPAPAEAPAQAPVEEAVTEATAVSEVAEEEAEPAPAAGVGAAQPQPSPLPADEVRPETDGSLQQATASPTPLPTAVFTSTPTRDDSAAQPTLAPPATPPATLTPQPATRWPGIIRWLLLGTGLMVLAILVVVGVIVWRSIGQRH